GHAVALRWRPAWPLRVASVLFLVTALPPALLAAEAPALAIAPAQLASGIAAGLFTAFWDTAVQQGVPEEALSRVSAYDWMGSMALAPLGMALAGPASELLGVGAVLAFSAMWALTSTAALICVPAVRHVGPGSGQISRL